MKGIEWRDLNRSQITGFEDGEIEVCALMLDGERLGIVLAAITPSFGRFPTIENSKEDAVLLLVI